MANLNLAEFWSRTADDNKDHDTGVYVDVKTANGQTLLAQIANADNSDDDATEYNDGSEHTIKLAGLSTGSTKDDCNGFKVSLKSKANGGDKWKIETARVILYFTDGTNLAKEIHGIELDSDDSNFSNVVNF